VDPAPVTRVALLDGFGLQFGTTRPGRAGEVLPRGVQRLVARLGLSRRPARTAIAGQLWPDVPERCARGSLRSALWRVHKIAPGLIVVSGDTLSLAAAVQVDVRELTDWARRITDPGISLEDVSLAEGRLRGDLLPGWYEDWVLVERERLRQVRLHALEALADRLSAAGRYGDAVQAAYAAVHAEPLRESGHRAAIRVHLAEGNVVEAVRAYETFRTMLADELGCEPTRHMRNLLSGIRTVRVQEKGARRAPAPADGHALCRGSVASSTR
jgi:DNA-binding SARP family transcriptional activator